MTYVSSRVTNCPGILYSSRAGGVAKRKERKTDGYRYRHGGRKGEMNRAREVGGRERKMGRQKGIKHF